MKSLSGWVRSWEKEVSGRVQGFNNVPGRLITDCMYRDGIRGDPLGHDGCSFHEIELLRDLAKAYEAVRRRTLRDRYPSWLLRLSCNAYGWSRRLEMLPGMVGPALNVPKGICAG